MQRLFWCFWQPLIQSKNLKKRSWKGLGTVTSSLIKLKFYDLEIKNYGVSKLINFESISYRKRLPAWRLSNVKGQSDVRVPSLYCLIISSQIEPRIEFQNWVENNPERLDIRASKTRNPSRKTESERDFKMIQIKIDFKPDAPAYLSFFALSFRSHIYFKMDFNCTL